MLQPYLSIRELIGPHICFYGLGQRGTIPALMLPCGMAAMHRKGTTAERFDSLQDEPSPNLLTLFLSPGARWPKWLEPEFTDRKVRGSNPTSATRLFFTIKLSNKSWLYGSEASVLNTDVMLSMMMMMA
ncbi:hypothetical protein T265_04839 [Opisthorchis viverrini]|uniref:Uncharacterized protein n=1 Tax=Opisthorchis viverrini TaxID=6198 RepID=A0A074ZYC0_OPIVI|nr:hypothetical protein T265_04839 [Opisthorchis viverrini]KER28310.1 hypothetical protein T265_04839 [Opisthorchis viverrini]